MKTSILLAALCICATAHAASYRSVQVNRTDGTTIAISIESGAKVTIADGSHLWTSDKGSIEMPSADVRSWQLSTKEGNASWSGIADAATSPESVTVTAAEIVLGNLPERTTVTLHDINGRTLHSSTPGGECTISLLTYPAGIYILTVNNRSIKIRK